VKNSGQKRRALPWYAAMCVLLATLPLAASEHRSEAWARSQFVSAERLHQALEAQPVQELTRADYLRVINSYRRVYLESPTSTKADPSVVAVAQLLEEMGRRFGNSDILRSAVEQYEFLRRQYPGSKARFAALFHIGEIYKEDLQDKQQAKQTFEEFLRRYPRNQFADQAQKELAELTAEPAVKAVAKAKEKPKLFVSPPAPIEALDTNPEAGNGVESEPTKSNSGRLVRVVGVRHWPTADGMLVAIDIRGPVKFESQRIEHPDRVFFDLFDTKVNLDLLGKSFDLDSDLLKRIRISQYKPRETRVVLEIDGGADVEASLVANPPHLLLDVRNKADMIPLSTESSPPEVPSAQATSPNSNGDAASVHSSSLSNVAAKAMGAGLRSCGNGDSDDCADTTNRHSARTVVTASNGIKKTIVDADEEEDAPRKMAKADVPETKPPATKTTAASSIGEKPGRQKKKSSGAPLDAREAQPTASGDRSLIRALGLKIGKIVIDPGHGGHDTGTIGPNGLEEKDLVLDVSTRLGKLLQNRLGAEVIYTRSDDTFIPLETRTAIANREGADLFISVHANSSRDADARGVETYYLNFTSSAEALEVAARENAVSEKSIHELQDLVKKIALKEKIEESREFAVDVDHSLHSGLTAKNPGLRDRGVKKAPFIVLIGANMPSILAEISFLSNPTDERRLRTPEYRQRIAESLYRGVAKYVNGLSGVKVASKIDKEQGQ
jgi:N-acetylmuramoyl-L-alanine amidase